MANFLTQGELKSHIYEDVANEITRNDDSIILDAIDTAIDEMKGYLTKYNTVACIDTVLPDARNKKLLSICKQLSCWHLIQLCNTNINYDKYLELYELAIKWLADVQKGIIVPSLPLPAVDPTTPQANQSVKWSSNTKRNHHI